MAFHLEFKGHAKTDQMKADGKHANAPFKVMAQKYGMSEAQILLRWAVQKGYPVLPKSTNPDRIRKNADIFSFNVDDEDMAAIEKMDRGDGVAWAIAQNLRVLDRAADIGCTFWDTWSRGVEADSRPM